MKKYISILLISIFGCSNNLVWNKPGASQNDFANDKYVCLQQSQQYSSGSYIAPNALLGGYQGFSSGGMGTNSTLFESCMNSKGWYLTRHESGVPPENRFNTQSNNNPDVIKRENQRKVCDAIVDNNAFLECMRKGR